MKSRLVRPGLLLLLGCSYAAWAQTPAANNDGALASSDGARLTCAFQRLEGEATRQGLWLVSTVGGQTSAPFRVLEWR